MLLITPYSISVTKADDVLIHTQPESQKSASEKSFVLSPLITHTTTLRDYVPPSPRRLPCQYPSPITSGQAELSTESTALVPAEEGAVEAEAKICQAVDQEKPIIQLSSSSDIVSARDGDDVSLSDSDSGTSAFDERSPLYDTPTSDGRLTTPPLLGGPGALDDAIILRYNGDPTVVPYEATEVDPEEMKFMDDVELSGLPALAMYVSAESPDAHTEDGEFELVDEIVDCVSTPQMIPSTQDGAIGAAYTPHTLPAVPAAALVLSSAPGASTNPSPAPRPFHSGAMARCKRNIYSMYCGEQGTQS